MPANSQDFARRVLNAFASAGRATDAAVVKADGPSTSTMTKLRKVAAGDEVMSEPREPTWTKIDAAADWESGSARRVWEGLDPIVGGRTQDAGYVAAPGPLAESGITNSEVLAELRAVREELRALREGMASGSPGS